jgi:tetratricopeptide (TPR) repeat protein
VTVQVLDADDGTHLWAETYDRDLTAANLFEVQDQITEQVAGTIGDSAGILVRAELEAIKAKPTDSLDAYECVLRAVAHYDVHTPETHLEARDCLERAVELDPNYAAAWTWLAWMYLDEDRFGFNPRPGSLDRALEAAQRAVVLDADDENARLSLVKVHFHRHELDAFFAEAERAVALNPNNSMVLANVGLQMILPGELDRGFALINKAIALNPNHPEWYHFPLFHYHYLRGEYEKALDMALKINMPGFFWTHVLRAAVYGQLGRKAEAREAADKLLELYPTYPENARDEFRKWNFPEEAIEHHLEGMRKAGLDIPDAPDATY